MSYILLGDRKFEEKRKDWPEPVDYVEGTITYKGDDFARSRGWDDVHFNLNQTNMVQPMFYLRYDGSVVFAKDIIRLDKRMYWVNDWWKEWLGPVVWPLYCQPSFGFEDTNEPDTDPDIGPFKQQTIDCGCNLHKLLDEPFWTRNGMYWRVEGVNYFSRPDPNKINYKLTPHLITKQSLASISQVETVAYITHQLHGDLVWPKLYEHSLIMSDGQLERFPAIPFHTTYLGVGVSILGYCFQGSTVYGLFPDGWRVIEYSVISGLGSAYYDRRILVDKWMKTPPPTIKGWTRGIEEKFDWQL